MALTNYLVNVAIAIIILGLGFLLFKLVNAKKGHHHSPQGHKGELSLPSIKK